MSRQTEDVIKDIIAIKHLFFMDEAGVSDAEILNAKNYYKQLLRKSSELKELVLFAIRCDDFEQFFNLPAAEHIKEAKLKEAKLKACKTTWTIELMRKRKDCVFHMLPRELTRKIRNHTLPSELTEQDVDNALSTTPRARLK